MPGTLLPVLWLVPALPLAGFVANGALALLAPGKKRAVSVIGVGVLGAAFLVAAAVVLDLARTNPGGPLVVRYWSWMPVGALHVAVALQLDQLSAVMLLVVTGVGALIHVYSVGYMHEDPGYARYFAYLNLFVFFMLTLVLGASFPVMFVGWEGVGLCSYLLIGFWFKRPTAIFANLKAFLVNRVGDFGFLLGIAGVLYFFHTLDYTAVFAHTDVLNGKMMEIISGHAWSAATVICICLFIGAMGKSAQVPLHVWLPDSMEGPTPISALIHAATMVTAGIFMVARMSPLFELSETALSFVLVIGATTAFFTGLIGIVQNDIKRVVAYSTLSQLGYM
ncbi:MAG: NADH-quinone oxidoreductase subunit L, partial [Gammaproteobacteria bacterium]